MKLGTRLVMALIGAFVTPWCFGQQISVDFNPATTKINWSLVGNVHTTHGTFQLKQGHVEANPATGAISGDLLVDPNTGESNDGPRDRRMKKEILETDKYPEIRFKVTKLEGVAPNFRVSGQFTIHGASHELSIPIQMKISGDDVSGTGKFAVPFVDWGMKDPSNFLFKVEKTVEVELLASGHIKR